MPIKEKRKSKRKIKKTKGTIIRKKKTHKRTKKIKRIPGRKK